MLVHEHARDSPSTQGVDPLPPLGLRSDQHAAHTLLFEEVEVETLPTLRLRGVAHDHDVPELLSGGLGAQAFYALWAAEMFATRYRASAQGILFFTARIVVGMVSYWFPTLLAEHGVPFVGMIMIGALVVAMVIGVIGAPDTRGKSLEEIETERYGHAPTRGTPVIR